MKFVKCEYTEVAESSGCHLANFRHRSCRLNAAKNAAVTLLISWGKWNFKLLHLILLVRFIQCWLGHFEISYFGMNLNQLQHEYVGKKANLLKPYIIIF